MVHRSARFCLPARHLHSIARLDPSVGNKFPHPGGRYPRHVQHVAGGGINRMADLRAQHHAVYFGLDHHSADDDGVADARATEKEGEAGRKSSINTRGISPLSRRLPGLRHRHRARRRRQRGSNPACSFAVGGDHSYRRNRLSDVARRAVTSRGIGNGISLIILAASSRNCPPRSLARFELGRQGALSTGLICWSLHCGGGDRLHRVHGAGATPASHSISQAPGGKPDVRGQSSHLPLKLNTAGVIPPIFASSLLLLPSTVANFNNRHRPEWFNFLTDPACPRPAALSRSVHRADCILCVFLYSHRVQPERDRRKLKKHGGFIPGIRPGERTAEYIDYVLTRITWSARLISPSSASCRSY